MIRSTRRLLSISFYLSCLALGGSLLIAATLYLYLSPKLPSVETLKSVKFQTPMRIYSQDLKLIGEFGEKRRTPIERKQIPPSLVHALLAAEDDRFYHHIGIDINGLIRAGWDLVRYGEIKSGGSTLTMQLARNFFLTRDQTYIRKLNEILLALRIEDEISKDDILTLYANKVFLGNRAYGVAAAAEAYYDKPLAQLSLAQSAMIAGLPKAPSAFNPVINPQRAKQRRDWILGRMVKLGYITPALAKEAIATDVHGQLYKPRLEIDAPYLAEMARRKMVSAYGVNAYTRGFRVITTVDSELQLTAKRALDSGLLSYDWRHGFRGVEAHVEDPEQWLPTLEKTSALQGLVPAIVTKIDNQEVSVLITSRSIEGESELTLTTAGSLKNVRRYISENRYSDPISDFTTLVKVGDMIRLRQDTKGKWVLTQLPEAQAALVTLDPNNGAIKALSGGFDFSTSHFNRATQARRQPGSNFKPFIYSGALEQGMTAAALINDAPVVFEDAKLERGWRPENNSGKFYGPTRLRKALYLSRNLVSIRVLRAVGIDHAISTANKFGFDESALPRNLSLALGTHAVTPLEIATGYATFANGGYKVTPYLIDRIEYANGEVVSRTEPDTVCHACEQALSETSSDAISPSPPLAQEQEQKNKLQGQEAPINAAPRVLEKRVAYIMDDILKDVIRRGTATRALQLKRGDIAGKTGTTNGPRDAWFSGYNPSLVTTVWLGFDDNKLLGKREFGGSAALPIWMEFMGKALADTPELYHPQPEGIISMRIDPETGLRARPEQEDAEVELFREELAPTLFADTHNQVGGSATTLPEDLF